MGEAKRRLQKRRINEKFVNRITYDRFQMLCGWAKQCHVVVFYKEESYWSDKDEKIFGLVIHDNIDKDYSFMTFARDHKGRFRCVDGHCDFQSKPRAEEALLEKMAELIKNGVPPDYGDQDNFKNDNYNKNYNYDLIKVNHNAKLNPIFKVLIEEKNYFPAKNTIKEIGHWFAPIDKNFIREFQTEGFDQRIWELYLWAAFRELNFSVTQLEAPDFLCSNFLLTFSVEATTVNNSQAGPLSKYPDLESPDGINEFIENYMPMKFASSLDGKLKKKNQKGEFYWERNETKNKPFVIAIADFHNFKNADAFIVSSLSNDSLWRYLYGKKYKVEVLNGKLNSNIVENKEHFYKNKKIPSGFFNLPTSENISAIIYSNAGTINKFNRMGIKAGWIPENYELYRRGKRYRNEIEEDFDENVLSADYTEHWADEIQIFHNPNAKHKIPLEVFEKLTQYYCKDGQIYKIVPDGTIIYSFNFSGYED